jgi:hypothetical protein
VLIGWLVAAFLWVGTVPIAKRVARSERDPGLYKLLMWAVSIHILFAPLSSWVIDHFYGGLTDYHKYIGQGVILGQNFDSFQFTLSGTHLTSPVGAGGVAIGVGIIFALIGANQLGALFVFGWMAFLGSVCFFRAFSITFPEAQHRRYALMIFFLPSILFWTAGVSKESIMYASLGIAAYGAARILRNRPGGVVLLAIGAALGLYVRPQELLIFLAATGIAVVFREGERGQLRGFRRIGILILMGGLTIVALNLTKHISGVFALQQVNNNNATAGNSVSAVPYSSNPAKWPVDLYYVLFDPLFVNAHGSGQRVASVENFVLITLMITSWRRLRYVLRAAFMRTYVLASILYCGVWIYSFSALGNLGLIGRERVLMLPFFLVLLCIPVAPKGKPKQFPWELSRRRRRQQRASWSRRAPAPA